MLVTYGFINHFIIKTFEFLGFITHPNKCNLKTILFYMIVSSQMSAFGLKISLITQPLCSRSQSRFEGGVNFWTHADCREVKGPSSSVFRRRARPKRGAEMLGVMGLSLQRQWNWQGDAVWSIERVWRQTSGEEETGNATKAKKKKKMLQSCNQKVKNKSMLTEERSKKSLDSSFLVFSAVQVMTLSQPGLVGTNRDA